MAMLKRPLFSFGAKGRLGKATTFLRRRRRDIVERTPVVPDARSDDQIGWRTMFQKCTMLWHDLSAAEKRQWEIQGTLRHMTGYAWWQSQCLRPNPGIYLPLLGGTMQGEIDMDDNHITGLIDPTSADKAARKGYVDAQIAAAGHTQGARVGRDANQNITENIVTAIAFNAEYFDTDNIHHLVTNNSRLTCRTAGKYLIYGAVRWGISGAGVREHTLVVNAATTIAAVIEAEPGAANGVFIEIMSVWDMAVDDYVEIRLYQTSGSVLAIIYSANQQPVLGMQRIG